MNHFAHTWGFFNEFRMNLQKAVLFLQLSAEMNLSLVQTWNKLFPDEEWIPEHWLLLSNKLEELRFPTCVDLLRLRQINYLAIAEQIALEYSQRQKFLSCMDTTNDVPSSEESEHKRTKEEYVKEHVSDQYEVNEIMRDTQDLVFYFKELNEYIMEYGERHGEFEFEKLYTNITLDQNAKESVLTPTLNRIHGIGLSSDEMEKLRRTEISFDSVTVDMLRERI